MAQACAAGGAGGSEAGGLAGDCAVCFAAKATHGFLHQGQVHCCLCVDCEAEFRRRNQLRECLMCRRRAEAVVNVLGT